MARLGLDNMPVLVWGCPVPRRRDWNGSPDSMDGQHRPSDWPRLWLGSCHLSLCSLVLQEGDQRELGFKGEEEKENVLKSSMN